ncbi:MAG: response regulator [Sulfuricella sp.]|nr:response regulator [Sulfuricella sp.]
MNSLPSTASIFDRKSIRYPFIRLIVVATLIGIGLTLVSDAVLMLGNVRKDIQRNLTAAANAAGTSASAAVAFRDSLAAREMLRMFEAYPEIKAAALYTNTGYRLAGYGDIRRLPADAQSIEPSTAEIGLLADSASLHLPIVVDETPVGTIYLKAQLDAYWHTYLTSIANKFFVGLGAGALVLLLALRFLDRIVLPVRLLAGAANEARLKQDFTPREIPAADDEIGELVRNFNTLLVEIDAGRKSIQTYQNELEYLVASRTAALLQANRELLVANQAAQAASRAKSEFLANMSHEIRTPMNAIIGMTQLALQSQLTPKPRNYLEKVDVAASELLSILNDILDFSKVEAGKMEFEQVDFSLADVLERLSDISKIKAQDKGIALFFDVGSDVPAALVGDPLRLGQVLNNLVNNAIKFTEKGSVTVSAQRSAAEGGGVRLRFAVSDTGIGLSEEQRNRLFSPFTQADSSTTRKFGGTGLGLSICKHLVEMMGGEIQVVSQPGVGSTFIFTAKFGVPGLSDNHQHHHEKEQCQASIQETAISLRGAHLLLVEDNAVNQELALGILESAGIRADVACNGAEAVEMVRQKNYDAVLMDCQMPVMDGFEAAQKIRADWQFANLPIIAMTANVMAGDREKCFAAGMNDHIAKPLNFGDFFSTLARWVQPHLSQVAVANVPRALSLAGEDTPGGPLPESEVPRLSGVDADEALKCVDGNVAFYRKVLAAFRKDQAEVVARIRDACSAGDRDSAVRLVHTLRGLAGNVGARGLVNLAAELESALRSERDDMAESLLPEVEKILGRLIREIDIAMPRAMVGETSREE